MREKLRTAATPVVDFIGHYAVKLTVLGGNIQSQPNLMTKLGDPKQKLIKNPFNSQRPGSFPGVMLTYTSVLV